MTQNDTNALLAGFGEEGLGLPETAVTALTDVVHDAPRAITDSSSTVDPTTVKEANVGVIQILLDDSDSMSPALVTALGISHDTFVDAMGPAIREGVAILVSAVRLSGRVEYPFTHVKDAPRYGREPEADEILPPGITRSYRHMPAVFRTGGNTPLRDRLREMTAATLAEAAQYDNPRVNREANATVVAITDGLDMGSKVPLKEYSEFAEEMIDTGRVIHTLMYVGGVYDPGHPRYSSELYLIQDYLKSREQRGHLTLPVDYLKMTLKDLLYWYFGLMGIRRDRVHLAGADGKAIRRSVGQMSQMALQQSANALSDDEDDEFPVRTTGGTDE